MKLVILAVTLCASLFAQRFGQIDFVRTTTPPAAPGNSTLVRFYGSDATGALCYKVFGASAVCLGNMVQSVVNDTNVSGSVSGSVLTLGWVGTAAAGRLNGNVVQSVTNDTNVTGSISAQTLTLGWAGTLAKARIIGTAMFNDQSNTVSTGNQDYSAATSFKVPSAAGTGFATAVGHFGYDSSTGQYTGYIGAAVRRFVLDNTALGGDLTGTHGAASLASILSPGSCGDTTHSCGLTLDAKGRVTAFSNNVISGGGGGGGASQSSDLIDCKVSVTGSVATIPAPCALVIGAVRHAITADATATLSGTSSTGTLWVYFDSVGVLTAGQITAATLTCNANCTTAGVNAVPRYGWPVASVAFVNNVYTTISDLRAAYSQNVLICGGNLTCSDDVNGPIQIDTGPTIPTKAVLQAGQVTLCADAGSTNVMTCTPASAYNGYTAGMVVNVIPNHTNTGAVTLAISGLATVAVKKADGTTALTGSEMLVGRLNPVWYDGTVFRLVLQ